MLEKEEQSTLNKVALFGKKDIVELLIIAKSVDINAKDYSKQIPLHAALANDNTELAKLLIKSKGTDLNALYDLVTDIKVKKILKS
ncbi:ankyrin repeat domain-containing protein [Bacteroidetes bacterium endosymbiont of Geopemphigus sp.]|uniref:ankyrin repeat domain-containing protein n=1 Tax=Bacteroidetes bacterium endosymbiont of Geopemphigus sp. TaxID=2047937 RepID=UPI000CD26026|nr:ankyrin repeat domain-containing protein [Bacteroidetes bacterium endosymbiont of Geopemphigus sp.]